MSKPHRDRRKARRPDSKSGLHLLEEPAVIREVAPLVHGRRHWLIVRALSPIEALPWLLGAANCIRPGQRVAVATGPSPGWLTALVLVPKKTARPRSLAEVFDGDVDRMEEELAANRDIILVCPPEQVSGVARMLQRMFGTSAAEAKGSKSTGTNSLQARHRGIEYATSGDHLLNIGQLDRSRRRDDE